ncbi:MAG: hypothetical protein MMC23_001055 [Stictis urceolatum]|nr:hypothetical protein [Stictis urceolata]
MEGEQSKIDEWDTSCLSHSSVTSSLVTLPHSDFHDKVVPIPNTSVHSDAPLPVNARSSSLRAATGHLISSPTSEPPLPTVEEEGEGEFEDVFSPLSPLPSEVSWADEGTPTQDSTRYQKHQGAVYENSPLSEFMPRLPFLDEHNLQQDPPQPEDSAALSGLVEQPCGMNDKSAPSVMGRKASRSIRSSSRTYEDQRAVYTPRAKNANEEDLVQESDVNVLKESNTGPSLKKKLSMLGSLKVPYKAHPLQLASLESTMSSEANNLLHQQAQPPATPQTPGSTIRSHRSSELSAPFVDDNTTERARLTAEPFAHKDKAKAKSSKSTCTPTTPKRESNEHDSAATPTLLEFLAVSPSFVTYPHNSPILSKNKKKLKENLKNKMSDTGKSTKSEATKAGSPKSETSKLSYHVKTLPYPLIAGQDSPAGIPLPSSPVPTSPVLSSQATSAAPANPVVPVTPYDLHLYPPGRQSTLASGPPKKKKLPHDVHLFATEMLGMLRQDHSAAVDGMPAKEAEYFNALVRQWATSLYNPVANERFWKSRQQILVASVFVDNLKETEGQQMANAIAAVTGNGDIDERVALKRYLKAYFEAYFWEGKEERSVGRFMEHVVGEAVVVKNAEPKWVKEKLCFGVVPVGFEHDIKRVALVSPLKADIECTKEGLAEAVEKEFWRRYGTDEEQNAF